jgi:hypothetical protein
MKNIVLFFLVVPALLICPTSLKANERRGAEVTVQKLDGQEVKGELIAVKPESLLLLDSFSATDVSIAFADITRIKITKKPITALTIGFGITFAALGTAAGYGLAKATWHEGDKLWPWAGGIIGLLSGVWVGAVISDSETIEVEGKSPAETKEIMLKLRSKARVVNFQ